MLTCCILRTDFPGGIIWWQDYDIAKRRGHWSCLQQSVAVRLCVLHTSTHHSRFLSLAHCTCLYPTATDSCGHATVSTPHQITPCRSLVFHTPACINTRTAQAIPSPSTSPCGTPHCRFLRGQRRRTRDHHRPLAVPRYTNCAVGSL